MSNEAQKVLDALYKRFGLEPVTPTVNKNQIRVVGRVGSQHARNWTVGRSHLLSQAGGAAWTVDISRHYFLRGGTQVWAWRVIFQASDIEQHVASILQAINNAPRARFELEEQPLPGVTGPRNMMNKNGKGAASAGTTPLLIRQKAGS